MVTDTRSTKIRSSEPQFGHTWTICGLWVMTATGRTRELAVTFQRGPRVLPRNGWTSGRGRTVNLTDGECQVGYQEATHGTMGEYGAARQIIPPQI